MEDKIKTLEAAVAGLQEQNKSLSEQVAILQKQSKSTDELALAHAEELGATKAQVAALAEHVATLTEQLENFKAPGAGVSASVGEEKRTTLPEAKPFKIGSKEVRFKYAAFQYGGQKVFAYEVAQDKTLREKIAGEFPGLIEPAE